MAVYTKESKLSEPIFEDPSIVAVINRFGFYLGVGDRTIAESCRINNIDVDFFLAIINTYLNPEYLEKTDLYYRDIQLPNIDRHFNLLIRNEMQDKDGDDRLSNLSLLNKFYQEVKNDLQQSTTKELEFWLPLIRNDHEEAIRMIRIGEGEIKGVKFDLPFDHTSLEDKVRDLISFFVVHLKGVRNHNLCMAVVSAIFILEKDIRQNNRIRNRIFRPLCEK